MEGELVTSIASDYQNHVLLYIILSMIFMSSAGGIGRASVEMERM